MVKLLHREVGAAGSEPSTVLNQRGEAKRLVDWIAQADFHVQMLWHNWKFLRAEFSDDTVDGTRTMAKPSDHNRWDEKTFFLDTDNPLQVLEYETVKSEVFETSAASETQPSTVIIMPDNSLRFDPVPDTVYTITADYFVTPTLLAADATVSVIPEEFHRNVIVARGQISYGNFENAQEQKDFGMEFYGEGLARLESLQLPNIFDSRYTSSGNMIEVIA